MIEETTFKITSEIKKQLLDTYAPRIFKIKSGDTKKEYLITLSRNHFTCSCPDATFKNLNPDGTRKKEIHYCKHQKELALKLLEKI